MRVNETSFDQPDVSEITPVEVPVNSIRSANYDLVFINEYGRYQNVVAYWNDIEKCWEDTAGINVKGEIVRHDGIL